MTSAAVAARGEETLRRASSAIIIPAAASATLKMPRKNASTEISAVSQAARRSGWSAAIGKPGVASMRPSWVTITAS
jgi:hypothetical protein